jgi:hypothetical protein
VVRVGRDLVKEILERRGIAGVIRLAYYNFAVSLQAKLRRVDESEWGKLVDAMIAYHSTTYGLRDDVLREIAEAVISYYKKGGGG